MNLPEEKHISVKSAIGGSYVDGAGLIIGELPRGYLIAQRFSVCETLGEGGMSHVYLCNDVVLNRQVAVKVMRVSAQTDEQAKLRFQREGQAVAMLSHDNVVKIHGLQFTEQQQPFLLMEVVQGISLSRLLEISGPLDLSRALKFLAQICDGIAHAHNNGVIHRDLKLSNIMVIDANRPGEKIKILDFGIAKLVNETSISTTQTGEVFGSPAYMSPEQTLGKTVDIRTDQYSLGCIAFELLTGRTPFSADNHLVLLMAHIQEKAPSVNEFTKVSVPGYVERTIARLLAKDPADRFENIEAVKKAFAGEIKVAKLVSMKKHLGGSYLAYTVAFIVCAGILTTIAFAVSRSHSVKTTTDPTELVSESPENVTDNLYLYNLITQNRYRVSFDDLLTKRKITDKALTYLKLCPNLQNLKLIGCSSITNGGIATVAKLPIINLNLNKTELSDSALVTISQMSQLEELSLDNVDAITNNGIRYLTNMPSLRNLSLSNCYKVNAETLKIVAEIKNLKILHVDNDDVASGLHYLAKTKITFLTLNGCGPNPQQLVNLTKMERLEDLDLNGDKITGKTLLTLAKLPALKRLSIKKAAVSIDDIEQFKKLKPGCSVNW